MASNGLPEAFPISLPPEAPKASAENPPWSAWDVVRICAFTLAMLLVFVLAATFAVKHFMFPKLSLNDVAKYPLVSVLAQFCAYLAVLPYMYVIATRSGASFGKAVGWNWPRRASLYILAGVLFSVGLQLLARLLPMPKTLPIDNFFRTPTEAWVLSIFGITLAPLLEELFFRGFLYPVLARNLGTWLAVVLTAIGFSLIHAPQLAKAWGPVLIVFLIGLALTIVRAVTKSVAASVLMHMAYNGTISVLLFIASSGFRHLEKIAP